MNNIKIGDIVIGDNHEPVVIAEIGINHNGSIDVAIEMADAAINAGAKIVKHQTHVIEDEMSDEAKIIIPGNAEISIYEIMKQCSLNENDEYKLMQHIESRKAVFISTPFSREAANRLEKFKVKAYKIGSGECNNYPLIKHVARFGKPMIISTGMNSIESIIPTVNILREYKIKYALLHCTNIYPTPPDLVRLNAITKMKEIFPDAVIGLSDHTTSNYTCIGAVALGASILERHFTDSMERVGPDVVCSMDPNALSELIEASKVVYQARGDSKGALIEEAATIAFAFASVVASKAIKAGEILTEENLWVRRPGNGDYSVTDYYEIIGKIAKRDINKNSQLKIGDF
jgi:N-acetylneuraminate synthase